MKRIRLLTALLALVALAACNDNSLPPGGTYQSVQGVVVDASTNQPIAGASVTVDTILTTVTDSSGKFTFAQVPVGDIDYQVTVPNQKSKYKPYSSSAHVAPDKPLVLSITLSPSH